VDSGGNLYFADKGNNRVRKVDTKGIITTFARHGLGRFLGRRWSRHQREIGVEPDGGI